MHADQALLAADGGPRPADRLALAAAIPDAAVLATVVQPFQVGGGQTIMAPVLLAVCLDCRRQQLGTVSKSGLVRG